MTGRYYEAVPLKLTTLERVASNQFAKQVNIGVAKDADTGGVMVAWYPPPELAQELALEGYEPAEQLHITLAYVGPDASLIDVDAVLAAAKKTAVNWYTMQGQLGGHGRFVSGSDVGRDVFFLTVDVPELEDLHERLEDELCQCGIWSDQETRHGFVPHMTLAYLDPADPEPAALVRPIPIEIGILSVVSNGVSYDFPIGLQLPDNEVEGPADEGVYRMVKADAEKRYTLGVMYAPDVKDAHGEYVEDGELHDSVIDFMRSSDRRLRLQHDATVDVGDIVEMMRWPYPVTIKTDRPVTKDDGTTTVVEKEVTLPAGTIFMGVIWDEEIWPYVKNGTIGGYSMGGRAIRVEGAADVPELGKDAMSTGDLSSVSVAQDGKGKRRPKPPVKAEPQIAVGKVDEASRERQGLVGTALEALGRLLQTS